MKPGPGEGTYNEETQDECGTSRAETIHRDSGIGERHAYNHKSRDVVGRMESVCSC